MTIEDYDAFLSNRRALMAAKIKNYYQSLWLKILLIISEWLMKNNWTCDH
jgi:hypothetical protein